mgnify:FL=1
MNTIADAEGQTVSQGASAISAVQAAVLQVVPGIASAPVFALLAWIMARHDVPNIFALSLSILLVEVPVCWAIMLHRVRRETATFSLRDAFPWMQSLPWWQYLLLGLPLVVVSMIMIVGIGPRIETALLGTAFTWVPQWFVMRPDPGLFAAMSRAMLLTLWALMFFGMVLAGGVTQELYARGFLLPRTQHLGLWAPAWNALWFAVLHAIAPWSWPAFFLLNLPWADVVWWKRSVKIGHFIHVGMLAVQWLGMTLMVFGIARPAS